MNPESDRQPEATEIEELIARFLDSTLADWSTGVEALCARHPVHADALRRRLTGLRNAGFAGPSATLAFPTWTDSDAGDPTHIGPYRIIESLGRGAQGEVFRVEDLRLGREVALKLLPSLATAGSVNRARFRREAEVASRLDHPGLCPVYDFGEAEGVGYIAMRLIAGDSLSKRLAGPARDPASAAAPPSRSTVLEWVRFGVRLARALAAAHAAGVVHRDVKPGNIMVDASGDPVVLDFGLAGLREADGATLTETGLLGTPAYMAPEQVAARMDQIGPSCDVWAMGVILYEAVTGVHPFRGPTRLALFRNIAEEEPRAARAVNGNVSRTLSTVIGAALEKDVRARYQSAEFFAADLERVLGGTPVSVQRPSVLRRVQMLVRRRPLQSLLSVVSLALIVLVLFITMRWGDFVIGADESAFREVEAELAEGHLLVGHHLLDQGEKRFRSVLERQPENPDAVAGLVLAALARKDADEALAILDRFGSDDAAFELLRRTARGQKGLENPRTAPSGERSALYYSLRASGLADKKRPGQALSFMHQALYRSRRPRPVHFCTMATIARNHQSPNPANVVSDVIVEHWPDDWFSWFSVGVAQTFHDPARAIAAYEKAAAIAPDLYIISHNLADVLRKEQKYGEALEWARISMKQRPASVNRYPILTKIGALQALTGDLAGSLTTLRRARVAVPADAGKEAGPTFANLARTLVDFGYLQEALPLCESVESLVGADWRSAILLADCHFGLGDLAAALEHAKRCQEFAPNRSVGFGTAARCLNRLGRFQEAEVVLDKALARKDWVEPDAARYLERLRHAARRFRAAGRRADKIDVDDPGERSKGTYAIARAAARTDRWDVAAVLYRLLVEDGDPKPVVFVQAAEAALRHAASAELEDASAWRGRAKTWLSAGLSKLGPKPSPKEAGLRSVLSALARRKLLADLEGDEWEKLRLALHRALSPEGPRS